MSALRVWLRRRRYVECAVCGREFRKGTGSGISRRTFCDDECYGWAWADFVRPGSVAALVAAKAEPTTDGPADDAWIARAVHPQQRPERSYDGGRLTDGGGAS